MDTNNFYINPGRSTLHVKREKNAQFIATGNDRTTSHVKSVTKNDKEDYHEVSRIC